MKYENMIHEKIVELNKGIFNYSNCNGCRLRKGCSCLAYHRDLERNDENAYTACNECIEDCYINFNGEDIKFIEKPYTIKKFNDVRRNIHCINCYNYYRDFDGDKKCLVYNELCSDGKPCVSCVNNWLTQYNEMQLSLKENKADEMFKLALLKIKKDGVWDENPRPVWRDENGVETPAHSKFITQWVENYDISKGEFPITQIKPTAWKTGISEIFWIYRSQSNDLQVARDEYGIKWWEDWNIGDGTIGFRYGHTVKRYNLINNLIDGIKNDPYGRRHIINLWQEEEFKDDKKGLKPCAFMTMWSVRGDYLDCTLVQRSNDACVAYNINNIQYVALQMMIAHCCGLKPGKFMRVVQNLHIYDRHMDAAEEYVNRYVSSENPRLVFEPKSDNFFEFTLDDFRIENYHPEKQIKTEVAI